VTKADIVNKISQELDVQKKDIAFVIDSFFEIIKNELSKGEGIELRGFGTFGHKIRKGRTARNPRSGEAVSVGDRVVITFKPGKEFKQLGRLVPVERVRNPEGQVGGGAQVGVSAEGGQVREGAQNPQAGAGGSQAGERARPDESSQAGDARGPE